MFDISREFENLQKANQKEPDNESIGKSTISQLLPLHSLIPDSSDVHENYSGILIMFQKGPTVLAPTSRLKFFADQDGIVLENEISAGSQGKREMLPVVLNKGRIWAQYDPGSTAILPKHQQTDAKSKLPCCIF